MKSFLLFILLSVLILFVSAETDVEFIDGNLNIKEGSAWRELYPGDSIPEGSILKVGLNSIVELSDGKIKFSITNPGVYWIDELILNSSRSLKARSMVLRNIKRLFGYRKSTRTLTLGVRAAQAPDGEFSWTNDEYAEYMTSGKEHLQKGDYVEAKFKFSDALDSAFEDAEEEEALVCLAYVETLTGNYFKALTLVKDLSPNSNAPYYNQAVLLKANLFLENFAADEAISWIETHKAGAESILDDLILLEGLGNLQNGEFDKARKLFIQLTQDNSDSEAAEIAAKYLESM